MSKLTIVIKHCVFLDLLHNDWSVLRYITIITGYIPGFLKHWKK